MLSRLNFCVNSQTPHASKNKRHKPYFFTHVVTVALSSSKILTDGKLHWPPATRMTTKNTYKANILSSLTFKVFQKHTFFCIKHLRTPSPQRWRRTVLDRFISSVPIVDNSCPADLNIRQTCAHATLVEFYI